MSHTELVLKVTLVVYILHFKVSIFLSSAKFIALLMLFIPMAFCSPIMWSAVACGIFSFVYSFHLQAENHSYLYLYWSLVCLGCCLRNDKEAFLRDNARVLIALVFTFATLWKVFGTDYLDGSFLQYLLSVETRFHNISLLSPLSKEAMAQNHQLLLTFMQNPDPSGISLMTHSS